MNVKNILFPTDFSESSDSALGYASSLASESGATLHIVHVGNESAAYLAGYGGFSAVPDLASEVERENRTRLDQVEPTIAKVKYQRHYLSGAADRELLDFAAREKIDLIVIGSHGRTGLSRLLLGSVAESVVRRAKCPVLTVKHPFSETPEGEASGTAEVAQSERPNHLEPISKHSLH